MTDEGLAAVADLAGLQRLDLSWTKVTDAALEHLRGLALLRDLDLRETAVTDEGVEKLRAALHPHLKIRLNEGR